MPSIILLAARRGLLNRPETYAGRVAARFALNTAPARHLSNHHADNGPLTAITLCMHRHFPNSAGTNLASRGKTIVRRSIVEFCGSHFRSPCADRTASKQGQYWEGGFECQRQQSSKLPQGIEAEFGVPKTLDYLVGEKFLNFIEASDEHAEWRAELPAFAAEIKTIFEPWQLAEYLETARQTERFDPDIYDDDVELERQFEQRRSAADLLLGVNWYPRKAIGNSASCRISRRHRSRQSSSVGGD